MSRLRSFTVLAAMAAMLMLPAASSAGTDQYVDELVFTWDGGDCPALPDGLAIEFTGTLRGHFHESVDANGVLHVNWGPDSVTGTAIDSAGGTYRFSYHNMAAIRVTELDENVLVTDHFVLVGDGVAHGIRVVFQHKFRVTEAGFEEVFFKVHGDPVTCDPI